jgi:hypothetical protein
MVHLRLSCLDSASGISVMSEQKFTCCIGDWLVGHVAGLHTYRLLLFRFMMAQIKYKGYRMERIYGYLGRKQVCDMQFTAIA